MSDRLTLKQVATIVSTSHHTIDGWCRRGLFTPTTTSTGRRTWTLDDVERLRAFIASHTRSVHRRPPRSKKKRRFASPTLAQVYDLVSKESIPELADRSGYNRDLLYHIQYGRDSSFTKIENILQALGYKLKIVKMED